MSLNDVVAILLVVAVLLCILFKAGKGGPPILWMVALVVDPGCGAARHPLDPSDLSMKEIVEKREQLRVSFERGTHREKAYEYGRYWLVAADGSMCSVGQVMYRATAIGQVLGCVKWRGDR